MHKYLVLLLVFVVLAGCEGFLVEEPRTEMSIDQYFRTPAHGRSAVNAIYRVGAGASFYNSGGFGGSNAMMGGYMSGLFDNEGKGERIQGQLAHDLSLSPVNLSQFLGDWWAGKYQAIARANMAIRYVGDIEGLSEAEAKRLMAEARFFRALNYLSLVKSFGDVPLVLEPVERLQDVVVPREDLSVVYEQIVQDLEWALQDGNLPNVTFAANGYRTTRDAAATLLADVHLQRAGYPLLAADGYEKAAAAARMVIHAGVHSLTENGETPDQSAFNRMRNSDVLPEYIYSVEYDAGIDPNQNPRITIPGVIRPEGLLYSRTLNMYRPINAFIRIYDQDQDLRIQNQQLFYNEFERNGVTYSFGEWAPYLWHEERALFETGRGDRNTSVYRYAQTLLIAAEAIARSEGVTAEAVGYLADVRSRAYWQSDRSEIEASLSGLSPQEFVEEVWKERLRELALEFKVWSDIQRTRKYPVTSAASPGEVTFVDVVGQSNNWGQTFAERHLLYPIPDNEMQRNPLLEQNPGY
ncbi:MAG: RagB/SusD family nutrient uptake outer membrane protein [Bacteroidota bacterium]